MNISMTNKILLGALLIAMSFFLASLTVNAAPNEAHEQIKQMITKLAGYDTQSQSPIWHIIEAEFEEGKGTGYFVAAYYKTAGRFMTVNMSDVWAVKDGRITKIMTDVPLNINMVAKGLQLIEMDGRSFAVIRSANNNETFVYSFQGNVPKRYFDHLTEVYYNPDPEILVLSYKTPLSTFSHGSLYKSYDQAYYFFECRFGELQEIIGESCTYEEFCSNVTTVNQTSAQEHIDKLLKPPYDYSPVIREPQISFYRLPGIGYYACASYYACTNYKGSFSIYFCHELFPNSAFSKILYDAEQRFITGYSYEYGIRTGYRYASLCKKEAEEEKLTAVVKADTSYDLLPLIPYAQINQPAILVLPGYSLWQLSSWHLGKGGHWPELYEQNQEVIGNDPDLLLPGTILSYERS